MENLKIINMADVESKKVEFLWYPYIPLGKLTIIQGDPGEGKTTAVLQLTALLTKGEKLPEDEQEREPINVIYQTAEDGLADTVKPRLEVKKETPIAVPQEARQDAGNKLKPVVDESTVKRTELKEIKIKEETPATTKEDIKKVVEQQTEQEELSEKEQAKKEAREEKERIKKEREQAKIEAKLLKEQEKEAKRAAKELMKEE